MFKKINQKLRRKNTYFKQKRKVHLKYLCLTGLLLMVNILAPAVALTQKVGAVGCPDVKIIFARGSGEERWTGQNYLSFKAEIEEKLKLTSLSYEFEDLDYPAINVANPLTLLSTFATGGEAYEFGESILYGFKNLTSEITSRACPDTKYVIGGYSQGAMVASKAIKYLDADRIIYVATFGDPKLYLPEGIGAVPAACKGQNLSNYRIYVPDCRAYSGLLGGYQPYQPEAYIDKLGTWCNKADIFCSSYLSMRDHTSYVADNIYADASKHIFDKITKTFDIKNNFVSLHDTAILIDSTGSMDSLIDRYKDEALRLAKKTLESGGRVALYDYRDINDEYEPRERCNFDTCTLESFQNGLDQISVNGGGDDPESLLSAGLHVMQKLNWNYGSTKSVVVLTDAGYHEPDLDGTTFNDVVNLSKSIDPVNFYFVVPEDIMDYYSDLALATGGQVVSSTSDLTLLTDTIIARFDSLPRVEDFGTDTGDLPEISDVKWEEVAPGQVRLTWKNTGAKTMVALNDSVLGVSDASEITLGSLDMSVENIVTLIPLSETRRGIGVDVSLSAGYGSFFTEDTPTIPKAPNTGRR